MRTVIVWREESDYAPEVREWLDAYEHDTGKKIEQLNPDTRAGADFAEAYDVVEYPTILALESDGKVLSQWRGTPLPQVEQVAYWS